ncbi:hypothetical protein DAPPUDRAFT_319936 [Daphnia pulex]|uniref:Helicase C-terminal domain-containing protein n=1 Tax=Daphnia pulex TaxID=6669 RepID=E9GNB2_DAPPU|nr:hypothetical protein DAPPUDRAFT_319936 [Daphnia pulex]|eukprot:EFX79001.1 hypothetical protein DAPPUDRAFT_319936 [Daphnia pulex]
MSEKASNVASGSGQQPQSEKRKTTSTKECMTGSTPEKKRFTPTIPPKRDRVIVKKSEPLKDEKSAQPDSVPRRENCGRGYVKNVMALNRISTRRRIMLSGTPLQNNLMEFFTMVEFVNPGLLGTNTQFEENFVKVFVKGQTVDSELSDVRAMKVRSFILHKTLENTLQRFDINVLTPFLPPKLEYVVSVRLSELQIKLYKSYLENVTKGSAVQPTESKVVNAGLFHDYQKLSQICTHPKALILAVSKTEEESDLEEKQELADQASSSTWWSDLVSDEEINKIDHGGKILLLMDILRHCEKIGEKLLVFSQSLAALDLIEEFLANNASEVSKTWNLNKDYFRMDGSTKPEKRLEWGTAFNDPKNPRARFFLTSTKAGGIGINLKGANRVIIFDVSWNPSVDEQSVFRAYRLGQHKPCYVYRFVAQGTMEEIMYYRQVEKLALSRRIVDGEQTERHFASNDLKDLYAFDPDGLIRLPDSDLGHEKFLPPKDDLLRELMEGMGKWIGGYREHDCLLQNRPEDELDDGEQEAIWKIFQTKKVSFSIPEVPK